MIKNHWLTLKAFQVLLNIDSFMTSRELSKKLGSRFSDNHTRRIIDILIQHKFLIKKSLDDKSSMFMLTKKGVSLKKRLVSMEQDLHTMHRR